MSHVRGEKVQEIIRKGLCNLAAGTEGKYVYSVAELARLTGLSRTTLYKHVQFVDEVLKDIEADKKASRGHSVIEFMREKMGRIEGEKQQLKKEVDVLRNQHAQIFKNLYMQSANLASLVKPVVVQESKEAGHCTLCQQEVDAATLSPKSKKVVKMIPRKDKEK